MFDIAPSPLGMQASLFGAGEPRADASFASVRRLALDRHSWVDHAPRWLHGADDLFSALLDVLPWRQRRVVMYDRLVDEPRLTWWWDQADGPEPVAILAELRQVLSGRYGRAFDSVAANLYRDGSDSVAWHADRVGARQVDPLVAIVSLGESRPFLLRPRDGGGSRSFLLGHGDLLVMGGGCPHD